MNREKPNEPSKRFYSYSEDTKAVAHIDILGFGALTQKVGTMSSPAALAFTLFENCILRYRESMKQGVPSFQREVPADLSHPGHRHGFWYKEVPQGTINFIYISDTVLLYSSSVTHLLREVSGIMGAAVMYGVPVRGTVTIGDLHHSEWVDRPGSAICLYGGALTRAVEMDKVNMKGTAMRVGLDESVVSLMKSHAELNTLLSPALVSSSIDELKWWHQALSPTNEGPESHILKDRYERWYTEQHTKDWFTHQDKINDSRKVINDACRELVSLGR